jgi:hypothetical protein
MAVLGTDRQIEPGIVTISISLVDHIMIAFEEG